MGASGKWVKAITGQRKPDKDDDDKVRRKTKKWGLWRSSSSDLRRCSSGGSNGSSPLVDAFSAAMAKVVRAPPKDFRAVRQEWAAIRIQTAFRGFLARRALRALKGIVRIQALVRGRQVRKKAAVTLRCMQALVRVQARVRARHVRMSVEGQAVQRVLDEHRTKADLLKQAEQGWCDSKATIEDIKVTIQMKQVGAFKRERAMAYSLAHKQLKNIDTKSRSNTSAHSIGNYKIDKNSWGWSWLERWMAARPWETRLMDKPLSEITPTSKLRVEYSPLGANSKSLEQIAVQVKKNNVTTRISARPPMATRSSSSPSSDHRYDESSASPSFCTSATPNTTSDRTTVESCGVRPSYMNLTQSMKAKQKNSYLSHRGQRQQSMDEFQFMKNTAGLSYTDSINFSRPHNKSAQLESNLKGKKRENFLYY